MRLPSPLAILLLPLVSASGTPTHTRRAPPKGFVTTNNGEFNLNDAPFFHFSTTAYWLSGLNDADLNTTLQGIAASGIRVVRTWGFHDVTAIPTDGSNWFQLLANGTTQINTGPTGLQRLDRVLDLAEENGLHIQLTLTNNWSALRDPSRGSLPFPSGFLSNDYGGMDAYVRNFVGADATHDQFYTNQSLIDHFSNYLGAIVPRYANRTNLFAWEVANDPRCNSTQATSPSCKSTDITNWLSIISQTIKRLDPNHLVSSGAGGFACTGCPKLFPPPPPPQISPSAAQAKRKRGGGPLTPAKVLAKRAELMKKWRQDRPTVGSGAKRIRGRWAAPATKRQMSGALGQAFDGSQGVDSEDISNIPTVDMHTFQLFPDQNQYMQVDSSDTDIITQTIDSGISWIKTNADIAATSQKPASLTAFGVVSTNSSSHFVPFNTSSVTVADILENAVKIIGFTPTQQAAAYSAWVQAALVSGVSGIGQYQWGQNYTAPLSPLITESPLASVPGQTAALSPDDGYSVFSDEQKQIFEQGATQQTAKNVAGGTS